MGGAREELNWGDGGPQRRTWKGLFRGRLVQRAAETRTPENDGVMSWVNLGQDGGSRVLGSGVSLRGPRSHWHGGQRDTGQVLDPERVAMDRAGQLPGSGEGPGRQARKDRRSAK